MSTWAIVAIVVFGVALLILAVLYIIGLVASYDDFYEIDGHLKFGLTHPKDRKTPLTEDEKKGLKDILEGRK